MLKFLFASAFSFVTLTVYPAIIAKVDFQNGAVLYFTDEVRTCKNNMKAMELIMPDKRKVNGCWLATPNGIYVKDEEGDEGVIPYIYIKKPTDA